MQHRWVMLLATCGMVVVCGPAHANNTSAWVGGVLGLLGWLLEEGWKWLLVLVVGLVAFAVFVTWLITWLVCRARRSRAVAEAQTKREQQVADLQRRVGEAEKELEHYRKARPG